MKVYFRKYKLNEDVNIPPELSDQYLSVKKQIIDKQKLIVKAEEEMAKASIKVSQLKNEISIYQKNLIAIENKAKSMNKEYEDTETEEKEGFQKSAEEIQKAANDVMNAVEISGKAPATSESVDLEDWWLKNITESIAEEEPDVNMEANDADEVIDAEEAEDAIEAEEALDGDYVFSVKVLDEDEEEDIIAKFYQDEDDDFWKGRVVQGSEEPIESMQFDPDMNKVDIIEHLATIFDEVIEVDVDDYEEMLDDKEVIDNAFYGENE